MAPDIAIIGAGPCGLTFARLLQLNNIDYILFERDASSTPTPQQQGGTLDLHTKTGQLALKHAGLFEEYSKICRWDASTGSIQDSTGKTWVSYDKGKGGPEIDRVQLRRLLLDSIPKEKVRWSHAVKNIERDGPGTGWVIRFADGSSATGFKLIVGADGAWSKVRPLLTPTKPIYSGKLYIEGRISNGNPRYAAVEALAGAGTLMAVEYGKQVSAQQVADGSYRVYIGLEVPEDFTHNVVDLSDTKAVKNTFLSSPEYFANWAQELKDIIVDAEGPFRPWPMYRMPVESMGWDRVRGLALLGDAAHVSTPFVGEGVNWAMYDALLLAERIVEQYKGSSDSIADNDERLERAVAQYEEEMFPRAKDFIQRCMASEDIFFSEKAAERFAELFKDASQSILGKA